MAEPRFPEIIVGGLGLRAYPLSGNIICQAALCLGLRLVVQRPSSAPPPVVFLSPPQDMENESPDGSNRSWEGRQSVRSG